MDTLIAIPLLPLAGFLFLGAFGRRLPRSITGAVASGAMLGAFLVAAVAVWTMAALPDGQRALQQDVVTWFASGSFDVPLSLRLDPLSGLMVLVVSGIGFLIHVYSTGYMHEETESEYARYFSYLNLFAAFMLLLVLGANFLVMFVGWEGVGLCSYLLIGFWHHKPAAADAGKKAFVVNRIGDFGFILGMLLLFVTFGTLDFQLLAARMSGLEHEVAFGTLSLAALLLFVGATGKSAQIPLFVWLPDAMEGPTPVSALIHAATMVTAGVYMIGRNAVLFEHAPIVLGVVAVVGAATALMAGTIGLVQNDIKRVLAYSTVSQLGYMFLAMGVGAYAAGIFHLFTHAFFKALLFLGSGAVIHALAGEQDLRRMGGLKGKLPVTYWTFLVGALAIAGVPLLSGFFSKDEILYRTFASGHTVLWSVAAVTSLLTAIYMFRLVFLAFHGGPATVSADAHPHEGHDDHQVHHAEGHAVHVHDAPPSMAIPLIVLAIGSIAAGYVGVPAALGGSNRIEHFLEQSFQPPRSAESAVADVEGSADADQDDHSALEVSLMAVSTTVAFAGIGIAAFFFLGRRSAADTVADRLAGLHRVLLNKYYVDELYDASVVRPIERMSHDGLWHGVDVGAIDGAVNGLGTTIQGLGGALRRFQTGSVRAYAASLCAGAVLVVAFFLWQP